MPRSRFAYLLYAIFSLVATAVAVWTLRGQVANVLASSAVLYGLLVFAVGRFGAVGGKAGLLRDALVAVILTLFLTFVIALRFDVGDLEPPPIGFQLLAAAVIGFIHLVAMWLASTLLGARVGWFGPEDTPQTPDNSAM